MAVRDWVKHGELEAAYEHYSEKWLAEFREYHFQLEYGSARKFNAAQEKLHRTERLCSEIVAEIKRNNPESRRFDDWHDLMLKTVRRFLPR